MTTAAHDDPAGEHVDVLIVGAGLSGIGAAYRLQEQCPGTSYAVLEARAAIGGTWDLFRYPGVRSDSDVFTLSYPFRPWRGPTALADGASDPLSQGRKRTPPLPGGDAPIAASSAAKGSEAVAPRRSSAQSTFVSTCSTALPAMPFSAMER